MYTLATVTCFLLIAIIATKPGFMFRGDGVIGTKMDWKLALMYSFTVAVFIRVVLHCTLPKLSPSEPPPPPPAPAASPVPAAPPAVPAVPAAPIPLSAVAETKIASEKIEGKTAVPNNTFRSFAM